MAYYRTCPHCGAHLDPGEPCDCRGSQIQELRDEILSLTEEESAELLRRCKEMRTAASAANTDGGKAEQNLTGTVSTSNDTQD